MFLDNVILFSYLIISALCIILINLCAEKYKDSKSLSFFAKPAPFVMQFAFGGLFSSYIVFYSRSASFLNSWPFLLMLAVFFIGNEFFRRRYEKLNFHLSIFFIAVFSYSIFSLPVLINQVGPAIFFLSGMVSLLVTGGLLYLLKWFTPEYIAKNQNWILLTLGSIYVIFNILYFTNIIPPLPLSLKEVGVYHNVIRTEENTYVLFGEKKPWYHFFKKSRFHFQRGFPAYNYGVVFAPANIKLEIYHSWSYFDEEKKSWVEVSRISYPVSGGRDEGYRGYTIKENIWPGEWRVDIMTKHGQIIGQNSFKAIAVDITPRLEAKTK